jgi:hypothetical protein
LPRHYRDGRCRQTFFNKIFTGYEKIWCSACDPEAKRQSSEWVGKTCPRPKKFKFQKVPHQDQVDTYFDSQGVMHKEFVPKRKKTVNAEFYKGVTDRLLESNQLVRPAAFCSREFFFLLHDNAPAHKAASVCQFLRYPKLLQPFITHPLPPYFPDYFLFSKFENEIKSTPHCG